MDKNYLEDLFIDEVKGALNKSEGTPANVPTKLSDLENDIFYVNKREDLYTFKLDDFSVDESTGLLYCETPTPIVGDTEGEYGYISHGYKTDIDEPIEIMDYGDYIYYTTESQLFYFANGFNLIEFILGQETPTKITGCFIILNPTLIESFSGGITIQWIGRKRLASELLDLSGDVVKMNATSPVGTGSFSMNRRDNTVVGFNSHAEGNNTAASGNCSHAEGYVTTASGYYSHAEGEYTEASGKSSHAEGGYTDARGDYSHAEGNHTVASGNCSHAQGIYNSIDTDAKYAHIVGNGSGELDRSNAHTLDWKGNAWFAGTVEGTALILKSSTEGSTKRFKITVDDTGTLTATEITE